MERLPNFQLCIYRNTSSESIALCWSDLDVHCGHKGQHFQPHLPKRWRWSGTARMHLETACSSSHSITTLINIQQVEVTPLRVLNYPSFRVVNNFFHWWKISSSWVMRWLISQIVARGQNGGGYRNVANKLWLTCDPFHIWCKCSMAVATSGRHDI